MKIVADWIGQSGTQKLCLVLEQAGHRALFVGGCVRNAILGVAVSDIDIATEATPHQVTALAEAAGLHVIPTGIDHGTVTVVAHGVPHEVTTFRRDVETDGRRAVIAYAEDIAEDAARRDFTMNALYADMRGEVIDPLHGLPDLLARRVRFVGQPEQRIREDYLRILRFFRFHAHYGDPDHGLDAEGLAACAELAGGIDRLSKERVGHEMRKLLAAPDPAPSVAAMAQAGILARVLPGADPMALAPLVHLEKDEDLRWQRRLVTLGGGDAEDALRLSRAEVREIRALRDAVMSTDRPAALGWKLGVEAGADAVLARAALQGAPPPVQWQAEVLRGAAAVFPVTAADLMPNVTGPTLGARLTELEQRWLSGDLRLSRAELLKN
jgi:poly(A) polymerase